MDDPPPDPRERADGHATDRRLAEIVQGMTEACFAVDTGWRFTFVNERAVTLLRHQRDQFVGRKIWDVLPHLKNTPIETHYHRAMTERVPVSFEAFSPVAERWLEIRLFPISEGVAAFLLDISERKNAEESLRQSELKFALAFANNPAAIALTRLEDGCVLEVNETWVRLCGYSRAEMVGRSARSIWPRPEDAARFVAELREKGALRGWESEFRKKSGEIFVAEVSSQLLKIGAETLILSTLVDITSRKRAEESLRHQEALLRETGHIAKVGGWEFDALNGRGSWTPEVARIHELDPQDTPDMARGLSFYHGESRARIEAAVHAAVEHGTPYDLELEMIGAKGTKKWIRTIAHPMVEHGRVVAVRGSFQDITDRKRSEAAVRESEAQFRQVVENINEVFWITDTAKHTMVYISPAYEVIWGRTCASLFANPLNWVEAIHEEDRARVLAAARQNQIKGTYDEVYRIVRPDGAVRWVHDRAFPVRDSQGEVYRVVGTAEDITERKRAELRASVQHALTAVLSDAEPLRETARKMLEIVCRRLDWSVGDFWTIDRATRTLKCVEIWHPPSTEFRDFVEMTQRMSLAAGEGLPGRTWTTREAQWVADISHEDTFWRREHASVLRLRGALAFPIKLRGEVYGVVEFFSQASRTPDAELMAMFSAFGTQIGQFIERKQLEEQFRQAQKMEAIGTLAGGIAHDFNNVLAAIGGYTELAAQDVAQNPETLSHLQAVSAATRRATDLVRQILAFSRLQEQRRVPLQLWPVVDEAVRLLRATIPTTIEFQVSLVRNGPTILGDATQIHQIVMNLATNAAHAMKDRAGCLGVTLNVVEVDASLAATHADLKPGRYLRLGVSDSGHGMDAATLSRIFDPFFTTKGPGEGTGLGLAVVHGIVKSHEGAITVYSQPGKGTQFHLYFPAHQGEIIAETADQATPRGNGERILFVDDEEPLALMGQRALERLGYSVDAYTSPADAMAAFDAAPDAFALVVSDLTMPMTTGIELAQHVLRTRPQLPVIVATGYAASLTTETLRKHGIRELLIKPLTLHALGLAVHRAIASAPS